LNPSNILLPITDAMKGPPGITNVYLTFDDGPYPATSQVLDVLRQTKARATFFLCARNMEKNPGLQYKLIGRMIAEGHSLGNHGYDHDPQSIPGYKSSKTTEVQTDFTDNVEKFKALFAANKDTFPGFNIARLPGDGRFMPGYVNMINKDIGLPHASWDMEFSTNGRMKHIKNTDWQGVTGVAATFPTWPNAQDVLLLHDLHWDGKTALLKSLIEKLQERFTVTSLAAMPRSKSIKYP
jgi:peptidoglycan/xylan/chitin deacetylase (PgdA/CDA1 family)